MTELQRSPRKLTRHLAFGLSLLFIAYLAHAVFAQDTAPSEEPEILSDITLTEIAPIESIPTEIIPTETNPTVIEIMPQPDDANQPSPTPIDLEATPTVIEVAIDATLAFTPEPPALPLPTVPSLMLANVVILSNAVRLPEQSTLSLTIAAQGLTDVNRITINCQSDPVMLQGMASAPGEMILHGQSMMDSGFQASGLWTLMGDHIKLLADIGPLWRLDYQVIGSGLTTVTCGLELVDSNGSILPLAAPEIALTVETYAESAPLPTDSTDPVSQPMPTTEAIEWVATPIPPLETEPPAANPPLQSSSEPTIVLQVQNEDFTVEELTAPDGISYISGSVETALPGGQTTVTINGVGVNQTMLVQADGSFSLYVPPGIYQITVTAPYHLPYVREIQVSEQPLALPTITLQTVDVDGNGSVDQRDVNIVIQNFGMAVPPAPASADLNHDSKVNIYDLSIIGSNILSSG